MPTLSKKRYTPEEYLAIERQAPFKSEYYDGEMFAMAGASPAHNIIAANLLRELGNGLKGSPCVVYASDLRVKVSRTGLYTYPDATVSCEEPRYDDEQRDTLLNPTAVLEITSPSTQAYDRGVKFGHYRTIGSLKEYVVIDQDKPHVELYVRQPDGHWLLSDFDGLDAIVPLTSANCQMRLAELYDKVQLTDSSRPPGPSRM